MRSDKSNINFWKLIELTKTGISVTKDIEIFIFGQKFLFISLNRSVW